MTQQEAINMVKKKLSRANIGYEDTSKTLCIDIVTHNGHLISVSHGDIHELTSIVADDNTIFTVAFVIEQDDPIVMFIENGEVTTSTLAFNTEPEYDEGLDFGTEQVNRLLDYTPAEIVRYKFLPYSLKRIKNMVESGEIEGTIEGSGYSKRYIISGETIHSLTVDN